MSLQGSLDEFPLHDVLSLLAATRKTGELRVDGTRHGRVWVGEGTLLGVEIDGRLAPDDGLFQLLRLRHATFQFDALAIVPKGDGEPMEPLLEAAYTRLAEWRTIERVVPSVGTRVRLAERAPTAEIVLRADQWAVLTAVATGGVVDRVATHLGLGEFEACKAVKELVDAELLVVDLDEPGPRPSRLAPPSEPAVDDFEHDAVDDVGHDAIDEDAPSEPLLEELFADDAPTSALGVVDEPEPINRGRLLKFLSSTR